MCCCKYTTGKGNKNAAIYLINEIKSEHAVFSINIDETTDERERHVLNTILAVKGQSFLASTEVLDHAANHQSLTKSVNRIIQNFGLEDHVIVYITDNTGYCSKSYTDCLMRLYPKMIWVGCWAHIIDLIGDTWQKHFTLSTRVLGLLRQIFRKKV